MRTEALHKQNLNTEQLLETEVGTQRNFHKQKLLHTEDVLLRNFCAQKLLRKKNLYTEKFLPTEAFTYRNFYANKLLYREVFTHLSSCLIFHDHSPSVTFTSSFLCSFGQLPPSFSFHFARCSVRPRFVLAPSAAKQTQREPRNK